MSASQQKASFKRAAAIADFCMTNTPTLLPIFNTRASIAIARALKRHSVSMGRKGGGKKAFLKGVVAKPDVDDAGADQGSTEAREALPQPATSQTASEHPETPSAGPQLPDVRSTAEDLSSESRGQLTQRHKKVRCRTVVQIVSSAIQWLQRRSSSLLQEAKVLKEAAKKLGKKKKVWAILCSMHMHTNRVCSE